MIAFKINPKSTQWSLFRIYFDLCKIDKALYTRAALRHKRSYSGSHWGDSNDAQNKSVFRKLMWVLNSSEAAIKEHEKRLQWLENTDQTVITWCFHWSSAFVKKVHQIGRYIHRRERERERDIGGVRGRPEALKLQSVFFVDIKKLTWMC